VSPASLIPVFSYKGVRNLLVDSLIEVLGFLDEAKLLSNLKNMRVNRNKTRTVHGEQSNTVSYLTTHAMKLTKLFPHRIWSLTSEPFQPFLTTFVSDHLCTLYNIRSAVSETKLAQLGLSRP